MGSLCASFTSGWVVCEFSSHLRRNVVRDRINVGHRGEIENPVCIPYASRMHPVCIPYNRHLLLVHPVKYPPRYGQLRAHARPPPVGMATRRRVRGQKALVVN